MLVIHCGTNNVEKLGSNLDGAVRYINNVLADIVTLVQRYSQGCYIAWSDILPRIGYHRMDLMEGQMVIDTINASTHCMIVNFKMGYIKHSEIVLTRILYYRYDKVPDDWVHLSNQGYRAFLDQIKSCVIPLKVEIA